jgi:polyphosphate glucokinase
MNVLVIDIGGTNVKMLVTGQTEPRKFPSGPAMSPARMTSEIKEKAKDWQYDVISMGYPGIVKRNLIISEPHNLASGWIPFDFETAFGRPVRKMNDASMQALGSYKQGILLFLGLGTGLGSAIIAENTVVPMELAHLTYKKGTYEDYIGIRGLKRLGRRKWQANVEFAIERLIKAVQPDDIVLGGGNSRKLKPFPPGCRLGGNEFAFAGGFRMWEEKLIEYK